MLRLLTSGPEGAGWVPMAPPAGHDFSYGLFQPWIKASGAFSLAFQLSPQHCDESGLCMTGMMFSFGHYFLNEIAQRSTNLADMAPNAHDFSANVIGTARSGAWLEGQTTEIRCTTDEFILSGTICTAERILAKISARFAASA